MDPATRLPIPAADQRNNTQASGGLRIPGRRSRYWGDDVWPTVAGFVVGGLVVVSMTAGSSTLELLASVLAIVTSVVSPLIGLVVLALIAPLARPQVIPVPGLFVVMVAAMLFGMVLRLPVDRPRLRLPSIEVLLLAAFLLYAAAQVAAGRISGYSGGRGMEIASTTARLTEAVVTFGIAYIVLRRRSPYPVLTAVLASAVFACVIAMTQLQGTEGPFANLMEPVGESGRISGVFGDPNMFGSYLAAMITLAVALAVSTDSRRIRWTLLALAGLLSIPLLLTQSRGALVAITAGLISIAFTKGRRTGFAAVAVVALMVVVAYPIFAEWRFGADSGDTGLSTAADASGRVGAWESGLRLFASSPLFGIGYGQFIEAADVGIGAHNWYVQVLAELGLVGFALWALFIAATFMTLRTRAEPARRVGYSVLVVWMAASLTLTPPIVFRMTGPVLAIVAAACVAVWASDRRTVEKVAADGVVYGRVSPRLAGRAAGIPGGHRSNA